jgi:hypothetical protein
MFTNSMRPGCAGSVMVDLRSVALTAYVPVDRPSRRNSSVDLGYSP